MNQEDMLKCLEEYNSGQFRISEIATAHGVSTGKMYYALRDAGCSFSRKRRTQVTAEERQRRSLAQKGRLLRKNKGV